ncbi:MAG: hypothetical protein ACRC1P_10270 [Cellulosilyticaceae bacterium]
MNEFRGVNKMNWKYKENIILELDDFILKRDLISIHKINNKV